MDKKILIVEDELKIARFLEMELQHEGFAVQKEANGLQALDHIVQGDYDLILLDIMLPGMDGITICQKVRELGITVPIIMLTAKDSIEDKVQGLDIGADDYVTKPFAMQELLARIRVALRKRQVTESPAERQEIICGALTIYPELYQVMVNGTKIELTRKEYELLFYLVSNKNHVMSREQILQSVWGYDYLGDTNVVDVYIRYLRTKIDNPFGYKQLQTVRGIGYVIKDE